MKQCLYLTIPLIAIKPRKQLIKTKYFLISKLFVIYTMCNFNILSRLKTPV